MPSIPIQQLKDRLTALSDKSGKLRASITVASGNPIIGPATPPASPAPASSPAYTAAGA